MTFGNLELPLRTSPQTASRLSRGGVFHVIILRQRCKYAIKLRLSVSGMVRCYESEENGCFGDTRRQFNVGY